MINYTRKRRDSTSSTQTTTSPQTEEQSRRRSLRNVPTISSMMKSTSIRSIDTLDGVTLTPSMSRPISRRQSLTRATASSLAKMVNFTSSSDNALLISPSATTSKQPSRFNKLLKKKKNQPVEPAPSKSYCYGGSLLSKKQQRQQQQQEEEEEQQQQQPSAGMTENTTRKASAAVSHLPSPPATPLPRRRWSPFRSPRTSHESYSFDDEEESVDDKPPQLPPIENGSFSLELSVSDHRRRSLPPCLTPSSSSKKRHSTGSAYYTSSSSSSSSSIAFAAERPQPSLSSMAHRNTSINSKLKPCSACPGRENGTAGPNNERQAGPIDSQDQEAAKIKEDRETYWYGQQQQQEQSGADSGEEPVVLLLVKNGTPKEEEDSTTLVLIADEDNNSSESKAEVIAAEPAKETGVITTYEESDNDDDDTLMQMDADPEQPLVGIAPVIPLADDPSPPPSPTEPSIPAQAVELDGGQEPSSGDDEPTAAIAQLRPGPPGLALMHPLRTRATLVPATDTSLVQIVASCIAHADKLESLATDLSRSEDRVSELLETHQALIQSLDAREHRYMMHVQTYEHLLASQARMISELEATQGRLMSRPLRCWQPGPTTTSTVLSSWWPLSRPIIKGTIVSQHKNNLGHTTDIVVAGTCVAPNPPQHLLLAPQDATAATTLYHHYLLHIRQDERSVKYALCPVEHWVPDDEADTCQQLSCQISFGLLTRRHHCRSCGHVVCNSHSQNRLPLFKLLDRNRGEWARVCDACFYRLIDPN